MAGDLIERVTGDADTLADRDSLHFFVDGLLSVLNVGDVAGADGGVAAEERQISSVERTRGDQVQRFAGLELRGRGFEARDVAGEVFDHL